MRKTGLLLSLCAAAFILTGCDANQTDVRLVHTTAPEAGLSMPADAPDDAGDIASGKVVETMTTAGYTYVQVDTGKEKVWAAAPQFQVEVGDEVTVPAGMAMRDYHSQTLNRDFDVVYFVSSVRNHSNPGAGAGAEMPAGHGMSGHGMSGHGMSGHGMTSAAGTSTDVDLSGIEKPEGGKTVAEIHAEKAELAGKQVTLRGKVVKFNAQIMGKNWLHVRDGSGDAAEGTHDLTITTPATAKVGDTVLVSGELHLDRDFGFGYKYDAIVEDAKVTVE